MAITKQQKKRFAIEFMICQNGLEALERSGLPRELSLFIKLCNDDYVAGIIDEFGEYIEAAAGTSKQAHIAKLEKLFNQAAGLEDTKVFKFTSKGGFVEQEGKFISYSGAAKLSEQLIALKDWDSTGSGEIEVDLKLGESTEDKQVETEEERDKRVLEHFKSEGLL